MFSGTFIGLVCVGALLAASILIALLDKKEKRLGHIEKSRFLSKLSLGLFIAAFLGGVVVTLLAGIQPREETGRVGGMPAGGLTPPTGAPLGSTGTIGSVDEKEVEALQKKVAQDAKDVKSRERLGHLYLQLQDFEKVFQMAHETLQINPQSVESRVHMGMVLSAMGDRERALEQFDKALKVDPKNAEALRFKGMVEQMTGAR